MLEDDGVQPVLRTRWARRWAGVVLLLMLAWTVAAWRINQHQYRARVERTVAAATTQARARQALVEDGLRGGLAQLDGVAHMLTRLPTVRHAVVAAGPSDQTSQEPVPLLRSALQAQPELAAMNDFLASSAEELGADLIYLRDDQGNCVASSNAGTAASIVGQHMTDPVFFEQTRTQRAARLFAVGHSTGLAGMYFSAAIFDEGKFIGAVFVKRNTRALASMVSHEGAFVVDAMGVVIMSEDPRLLLRAVPGGRAGALTPQQRESLYVTPQLAPLRIEPWDETVAPSLRRIGDDPVPQVLVQRHMERDALDVYVAEPVPLLENLARDRAVNFALLALAGIGLIALGAAGLGGWRSRRSVLDAVERIGQANRKLSVEVAERERAEGALRESREYLLVHEARLRALLRSLPEQVWMKDRAGAYLAVNAEFERFQGLSEAEVLGKTDGQMNGWAKADHYEAQDQATLAASEPLVFQETERGADGGGERRLEITKTAVRDDRGAVIGVVGIARDMTEIQAAIAALEAAKEEAERANRSKSVFLANMSHEIRTPLNAVLGFTQLLMGDRKLPDETQARLRVIHSAGNRLLGLINDVLDLAKIESGSLQVLAAPFDLLQELRDIDALYGTHARAKGLALQSELALAPPTVVEGDRNKVGQIVANLLGNALKFTERGHIGLHVWRDGKAADRTWFEVHDTGPGIAPEELADLFVPFRQGSAGQEKGGTGLGLALSRDMARAMGGELTVASTPGVGTQVRFWLTLPSSRLAAAGAPVGLGAQVLEDDTPCTVLVIEDDPDSRDVLVNLLREVGCTVMQAFDGLEGLQRCRAERFDIVFSDIRMPHMNGVEMIERLRADPFTATLPVVAVSASSLEHERRFYIEHGFQDFIGKPYPFQDVYRALVDYAGVRLRPLVAPLPEAADEAPPADALTAGVRDKLRALAAAASSGQLGAVARLMEGLPPEAIGAERWRAFDDAAQAYDFQLLEQRVGALLSQMDAPS